MVAATKAPYYSGLNWYWESMVAPWGLKLMFLLCYCSAVLSMLCLSSSPSASLTITPISQSEEEGEAASAISL